MSNDQGGLFPYVPHVAGSDTSKAAAQAMSDDAVITIRETVYQFIEAHGPLGATDNEMQGSLNLEGSTQRPRRIELMNSRRIVDSGKRRTTASGRKAIVWIVPGNAS